MRVLDGFSTTYENRLDVSAGGLLTGPGTDTGDEIRAIGECACFTLNAAAVRVLGAERIDQLVSLAERARVFLALSPGEVVVPSKAVATLGVEFWQELNDAGLGRVPPDRAAKKLGYAIEVLEDMVASGGNLSRLSTEVRSALGYHHDTEAALETGAAFLASGGLGVALGAAVDEVNRQRQNQRLDRVERRAEEDQQMQRQSNAQLMALRGISIEEARTRQQEQAAVRGHLKAWGEGRRRIEAGDYEPFMVEVNAYNKNEGAFADGYRLIPQSTPEGPVLNHVGPDGTVQAQYKEADALKLFDAGMAKKLEFISPTYFESARKASAAHAEKEADRRARLEVADKYSSARMYGADVRADAQLEAADIRGGHATEAATIRANAPRQAAGPKGLTAAQERDNLMIDAAREQLAGLNDDDIKKRTTSTMASGRENPLYDPAIARAAKLAGRRKIGPDDHFDQRNRAAGTLANAGTDLADIIHGNAVPQSAEKQARPAGTPKERALAAMAKDPDMAGYTLGDQTLNGFKVIDKSGKHVGYYNTTK